MSLTNQEVKQLFLIDKFPIDSVSIDFPLKGDQITIELQDSTGRIKFQGDVNRNNKIADKITYQLRNNRVYRIRRLDINGSHRNPPTPLEIPIFRGYEDYLFLNEDHVHFYIEGYDDRWALPLSKLPEINITNNDSLEDKMVKFFTYCNIKDIRLSNQTSLF